MTILEKLQAKYPNVEGISAARNIAEAVGLIHGIDGRGAGAIADYIWKMNSAFYDPNGATGNRPYVKTFAEITPVDLSAPTDWTPPVGKLFGGWGVSADSMNPIRNPYYISQGETLYAIWRDSITLSFDANGGSGEMDSIDIPKNSEYYSFPECGFTPPADKAFAGWGLSADRAATIQPGPSDGGISDDLTLYAIWKDAEASEEP